MFLLLVLDYGSARTIKNVTNGLSHKTIGHRLDYNCSHTDHITQCEKCQNLNADTSKFYSPCNAEYLCTPPLTCIDPCVSMYMYFQSEWKTMWIQLIGTYSVFKKVKPTRVKLYLTNPCRTVILYDILP